MEEVISMLAILVSAFAAGWGCREWWDDRRKYRRVIVDELELDAVDLELFQAVIHGSTVTKSADELMGSVGDSLRTVAPMTAIERYGWGFLADPFLDEEE